MERPTSLSGRRREDRRLWPMVLVSSAAHFLLVAGFFLMPANVRVLEPSRPVSYTVDLIAPDRLGGTNLIEGGKGRVKGTTMAAREKPKPPPPPEPARAPEPAAAPAPPEPPKKGEPAPPVEKPDPDAFAAATVRPAATPSRTVPPKVAVAQVAPTATQPKVDEAKKKAEEKKKAEAEAKARQVAAEAEAKKKAAAEAEAKKKAEAEAKKKAEAEEKKRADAEARKKAAEEAALAKALEDARRKAEAESKKAEAEAKARDEAILAAVRRKEQQIGEMGAGEGTKPGAGAGGPISVGPGEGAGGQVMGLDYVLYLGQLERRLKNNWAWAGDANLEAVAQFAIGAEGQVSDVRITRSSGDRGFDASVERAVRGLHPLPPPPEKYRDLFADVEYTFTPKSMQP